MDIRQRGQQIVSTFQNIFERNNEDTNPSSFWDKDMVMLADEHLPLQMRLYIAWHEYEDRVSRGWYWHAPTRVFRLPTENQFLLAHKKKDWMVYDTQDQTIKHLANGRHVKTFGCLLDAITASL